MVIYQAHLNELETLSILLVISCASISKALIVLIEVLLESKYCSNRMLELVSNLFFLSFTVYTMSMEWRSTGIPHFTP